MIFFLSRWLPWLSEEPIITYIRVERPKLDLVGLVIGAFTTAGLFALGALCLGTAAGAGLVWLRRRRAPAPSAQLELRPGAH